MSGENVLENPIRIARLQVEKSAFYCNISMKKKRHMDQARTPTKSRDKPCAVDKTGRNDQDLNFIF